MRNNPFVSEYNDNIIVGKMIYIVDEDNMKVVSVRLTTGMLGNLRGYSYSQPNEVIQIGKKSLYLIDDASFANSKFPLYTSSYWSRGVGMGETYGYEFKRSNIYFYLDPTEANDVLLALKLKKAKDDYLRLLVKKAEQFAKQAYDDAYHSKLHELAVENGIDEKDFNDLLR